MELAETIMFYSGLTSSLLTALILISLYVQPRIWMQDLPKEVQTALPPKTRKEKKQSWIVLLIFLVLLTGLPALAVITCTPAPSFWQSWMITYSIMLAFNLCDLLLIDWLVICTLRPAFIQVKGVDERVYKNYGKHLKDFLKGIIILPMPSLISASLGWMIVR